ncbi:long-chain fatty acid--CoA ligase [Paraburkholderia strydomiana]|uniref:long-chain fatty acid--CoA ligase n=1 Tax=Paraburkholderia strydomiana TaxID=1245417 RepID=UPI0038B8F4C7
MRSTMMDQPLLISSIIRHAAACHGSTEIVSRVSDGALHRTNYAEVYERSSKLADALASWSLQRGDRVGTLGWNDHRHLEIYYGVSGAGFVCHTINPRLFPDQIVYIVNHASDRLLFVDPSFVGLVAGVRQRLQSVERVIVMCSASAMPPEAIAEGFECYEEVIAAHKSTFDWPRLDENDAAGLCYTSGTTGDPKGVLYSHRSTVLHALAVCAPDVFNLGERTTVMPVVPMFHVNGWGLPHAAPMVGARLVLPGQKLDAASLYRLITTEKVTFTAGVPTVWGSLLDWIDDNKGEIAPLERVAIGGAACPQIMAERFHKQGVDVVHAWGMTETSPVGLANRCPVPASLAPEGIMSSNRRLKQGKPLFGVETRLLSEDDRVLPHDGTTSGRLQVRGPWVASSYFNLPLESANRANDGWFETGDIATIEAAGTVEIVDRAKDVIKSGGEWISSVTLENAAMSHPDVYEAAAVARDDERWGERPVLFVVLRPGTAPSKEGLLSHLGTRVARWWVPDDIHFVDDLPHTATGKVVKATLRRRLRQ